MANGCIATEPPPKLSPRGGAVRRLIVSALPEEQAPLRRRLGVRGRELVERNGVWLGVTGEGALAASRKLREFIRRSQPDHIVGVGLGGGVSEALEVGAMVQGCSVRMAGHPSRWSPLHVWLKEEAYANSLLVSSPQLVGSTREKAKLWRELGRPESAVVDLESWAYAQVAQDAEIPLSIVKVISDAASENLPSEVMAAARPDGSVRRSHVVARALFNPRAWWRLGILKHRLDNSANKLADLIHEVL